MAVKKAVFLIACGLIFTVSGGCTVPLAMQGLSSTSPVAFSYVGRGKGDSIWLARHDDVVQATERAARALSLKVAKKESEQDQIVYQYVDDRGNKMEVHVQGVIEFSPN